jgi:hypothetical protein
MMDLRKDLEEANELLRSAHAIAARRGVDTNWEAIEGQLSSILSRQHTILHGGPKPASEEEGPPRYAGFRDRDQRICDELAALSLAYHGFATGRISPHGEHAKMVGLQARSLIRTLVLEWV